MTSAGCFTDMPVTYEVAERIGPGGLNGLTVVHINHLLNDILDLNQILVNLGASLIYVPIIYGSREQVLLSQLPYGVVMPKRNDKNGQHDSGGPAERFSLDIGSSVRESLAIAPSASGSVGNGRILVIEDGGYHYTSAQSICEDLAHSNRLIGFVEQTVAGILPAKTYFGENQRPCYPVVSVARSRVKMRIENQFLAVRILEELSLQLYSLQEFLSLRDVLLIGYGVIGRAVALLLRKHHCNVRVIEKDSAIRHVALCEKFDIVDVISADIFDHSPIVLGVTGTASFTLEWFGEFLKSSARTLYLVSGSSKRIEFSLVIDFFEGSATHRGDCMRKFDVLEGIEDIRVKSTDAGVEYHFRYHGIERSVILLADGYPVNFYRAGSESLPSRVIDLINAEILGLTGYLYRNHTLLEKKLYLFGHDDLPGIEVSEDELVRIWLTRNSISSAISNSSLWRYLSPHPGEDRLARELPGVDSREATA